MDSKSFNGTSLFELFELLELLELDFDVELLELDFDEDKEMRMRFRSRGGIFFRSRGSYSCSPSHFAFKK